MHTSNYFAVLGDISSQELLHEAPCQPPKSKSARRRSRQKNKNASPPTSAEPAPRSQNNAQPRMVHRDSTLEEFLLGLRDELTCPLTHELFVRPIVTATGHTFEKHALLMASKMRRHPITNEAGKCHGPADRLAERLMERFGDALRTLSDGHPGPPAPCTPAWLANERKIVDSRTSKTLRTKEHAWPAEWVSQSALKPCPPKNQSFATTVAICAGTLIGVAVGFLGAGLYASSIHWPSLRA